LDVPEAGESLEIANRGEVVLGIGEPVWDFAVPEVVLLLAVVAIFPPLMLAEGCWGCL